MPEIGIKNIENQDTGSLSLSEERFGLRGRTSLMHAAVVNHLANQRQGTAATKTRSMVRGGGKKPYRQKGTGRARAGTNTSPLWRGGGTVFGPHPRDYGYRMPRKQRRKALYAALSAKLTDGEITVVDELEFEAPKTRRMVEIINALGLSEQSLLIVLEAAKPHVALSARNIPGVRVQVASNLNAYQVLAHGRLLVTKAALEALEAGGAR